MTFIFGRALMLSALVALAGCSVAESVRPSAQFAVTVERVGLDALYLPDALVTVSNLTDRTFSRVTVSCRFLDKAGALIDVGEGYLSDVGPRESVSDHARSAAQYQKPAAAECRVDDAR
jgi:hypothetical protein